MLSRDLSAAPFPVKSDLALADFSRSDLLLWLSSLSALSGFCLPRQLRWVHQSDLVPASSLASGDGLVGQTSVVGQFFWGRRSSTLFLGRGRVYLVGRESFFFRMAGHRLSFLGSGRLCLAECDRRCLVGCRRLWVASALGG